METMEFAGIWRYDTSPLIEEPLSGMLHTSEPEPSTAVAISKTTEGGANLGVALLALVPYARLHVAEAADATLGAVYELRAQPLDQGTWVELEVEQVEQDEGVTGPPAKNTPLLVRSSAPEPVGTALCTVPEVTAMLKATDSAPDEAEVQRAIDAASDAIRLYTGRPFGLIESSTRLFPALGALELVDGWLLETGDYVAVEGVGWYADEELTETVEPVFTSTPLNVVAGVPYTGILLGIQPLGLVSVEALWGWPSPPEDVHYAAIKQAAAWYTFDSSRVSSEWAGELGAGARAPQPFSRSLLYAVTDMLKPYRPVTMS